MFLSGNRLQQSRQVCRRFRAALCWRCSTSMVHSFSLTDWADIKNKQTRYSLMTPDKIGSPCIRCPKVHWTPLSPRLTVFVWCSEFPSCLAPFEIGYNVEGMSTKIRPRRLHGIFFPSERQKMAAWSCQSSLPTKATELVGNLLTVDDDPDWVQVQKIK